MRLIRADQVHVGDTIQHSPGDAEFEVKSKIFEHQGVTLANQAHVRHVDLHAQVRLVNCPHGGES